MPVASAADLVRRHEDGALSATSISGMPPTADAAIGRASVMPLEECERERVAQRRMDEDAHHRERVRESP